MRYMWKMTMVCFLVLALLAVPLLGCGGEGGAGKTTITVGLITDYTGATAVPFHPINLAVEDLVRHINEDDPIPGVRLKIVSWDEKYDPSRDIPGWDWLRGKGASLVITPAPWAAETLKPFAERDKTPICTWAAIDQLVDPPGWVFCAGQRTTPMTATLLKWISEQWPNYPTRPKVATCATNQTAQIAFGNAVEQYCQANPDKFEFVGNYAAPAGTMIWSGEVEKLKDCDYIGIQEATPFSATFIKQYRSKGYKARLFDLDSIASQRSMHINMVGWEGMDRGISFLPWGWWGDPFAFPELSEELLYRYHPGEADDTIYAGLSYLAMYAPAIFFDIVRQTVEEVGAENFDGQAFYNTATKFKRTYEGYPERGFTETVRHLGRQAAVYEWRADVKNLVRITDWLPETQ